MTTSATATIGEPLGGGEAVQSARLRLGEWYRRERRPLAWRRETDPWAVWLSETLLQQTRAEHAEPYFLRLLERYPTVEALARTPLEELLGQWSGLGYYQRARRLHRAAREVAARGGEVPATVEELRRLPGVGEYTAAAVASIAFGVAEPALDGNVERVMVRLLALEEDPRGAAARRVLREAARELLDLRHPGESNQALMELGALVCLPQRPQCERCPISEVCVSRRRGVVGRLPRPRRRKPVERRGMVAAVVSSPRRGVFLVRRPWGSEVLEGTWEVPWAREGSPAEVERELGQRYGGRWVLGRNLGRVCHSVTFRRLEVSVHRAELREWEAGAADSESGWFDAAQRERLPRSSLVAKVLALSPRAHHPGRRRG